MSWAINGLLTGECLNLPGVRPSAVVGVGSTVMAIGLQILGFSYKVNVVTAVFAIAGAGGLLVTVIGAIAFSIFATSMQKGNNNRDW